ncbi:hypothetical protein PS2_015404 [Malus domestica]
MLPPHGTSSWPTVHAAGQRSTPTQQPHDVVRTRGATRGPDNLWAVTGPAWMTWRLLLHGPHLSNRI